MTAVTTVRTCDAALLITDCALCDVASGKMVGATSKQFVFPLIPAVAAVRGRLDLFLIMQQILLSLSTTARTFDDFKGSIERDLKSSLSQCEAGGSLQAGWYEFELHVAGLSYGQPASFFVTGHPHYANEGFDLFKPIETVDVVSVPGDDTLIDALNPQLLESGSDAMLRELVARQHAIEARTGGLMEIGGGVQVTRVTADGITTRYLP